MAVLADGTQALGLQRNLRRASDELSLLGYHRTHMVQGRYARPSRTFHRVHNEQTPQQLTCDECDAIITYKKGIFLMRGLHVLARNFIFSITTSVTLSFIQSSTLIALLWLIVDMAHHQARIYFSTPLHSHTTAGIISLIIYWLLLYALVLPQERLVKAFKEHEPLLVEARIKICYDGCNLPAQGLQQHSQCHWLYCVPRCS